MTKLKISLAGPADIPVITKIQKGAWLSTYPNLGIGVTRNDVLKKDFTGLEAARYQNMAKDNWRYFLARKDGRVIGYAAAQKRAGRGIIKLIHVLPEFWGLGVGSSLLKRVLAWLADSQKITLQVAKKNRRAIAFYQKFGFFPVGPGRPIRIAGKEISTVKMAIVNT